MEKLHEAIRRDFCLDVDEIQSIEPDFYYKNVYIRCANSQI